MISLNACIWARRAVSCSVENATGGGGDGGV